MWEILLNSVLNGWLKVLIMYLKIVKCVYKNSFFSTSAMQLGQQLYTISGSTCYSPPRWAANFPRRYALGLTRKWTLRNNKWDVIIITG